MNQLHRYLVVAACVAAVLPSHAASDRRYFNAALMDKERVAFSREVRRELLEGLVDPSAKLHVDHTVGVPNFLRAARGVELSRVVPGWDRAAPDVAARAYLQRYAGAYRLTARDVGDAIVREVHDTGRGAVVVTFEQKANGLHVFGDEWRVIMDRKLSLVALSGHFAPAARTVIGEFRLSPEDAVAAAYNDLTGQGLLPSELELMGSDEGGYSLYRQKSTMTGVALLDLSRLRPVMFAFPDGAEPGYYVEVQAGLPVSPDGDYFAYVISADTGKVLFRNDLTARHSFRVFASGTTFFPFDGPQGDGPTPHPTGVPDGYQAPWFPAPSYGSNLVNVPALFSRASAGDGWLGATATETTGNNVDAYADLVSGDGFTNGADLRANVTSPGVFDYAYDPNLGPQTSTAQQKAAVVELFYLNNFLHDWYYDSGFDEASRNAQADNYGRGGQGNDAILAEAQDYSGTDNANMSTPADGQHPRMQMYVFSGQGSGTVTFNSPVTLAGTYEAGTAEFGAQTFDVTQDVVPATDSGGASPDDGCESITNASQVAGKIALVDRGSCNFTVKAKNAQVAGAVAVLIANNAPGTPDMAGTDGTVTLGVLMISQEQGIQVRTEVGGGAAVNARARRVAMIQRDGTIDNTIVAHEWGHYISNRLINNANGLGNNQGRSMGEGWGDFTALHLIVREQDAATSQGANFNGVYGLAGYVMSGGANQGYYYGIRRVPYSTDFTKNALTFRNIQDYVPLDPNVPTAFDQDGAWNSEVHNAGEVWASMLWECYAALLRDTLGSSPRLTFAQAQARMRDYLVAGYKATPANPTFLEARDALLAAVLAADATDYQRCFVAFARRGAGLDASGPARGSTDHSWVVEQFSPDVAFVSATLGEGTPNCDGDGRADSGETGLLTVTLKNVGIASFTGTKVDVSANVSGVTFPNGNQISMPAYAPGATVTGTLEVQLPGGLAAPQALSFDLAITDPDLLVPRTISRVFPTKVNANLAVSSSLKDDVEGPTNKWVVSGSPAGAPERWQLVEGAPGNHWWRSPSAPNTTDQILTSPLFAVGSSNLTVTLKHRYRFEEGTNQAGATVYYDGAILQCSPDGSSWYDVPLNTGRSLTNQGQNPLRGKTAFAGLSAGYPAFVTETFTASAAQCRNSASVRLRLRVGCDAAVNRAGWEVDEITLGGGVTQGPFDSLVADPGTAPVSNAGADFAVAEGTTGVQLDGSALDCDQDALSYAWTAPAGIALSGANTLTPTFTAPMVSADTPYTFTLTTTDARGRTGADSVVVTVNNVAQPNRAPTANAGTAQTVDERGPVQLSGAASDPDDDPLTYSWTQQSGPTVTLTGATTLTPTFTAPEVGSAGATLSFQLSVSDGAATATSSVQVTVTHVNRPPTASAGAAQNVDERAPVTLSGTASDPDTTAPNDQTLTYAWTQQSGPTVALSGGSSLSPTFTAPEVGSAGATLTFQLAVFDGTATATSTVQVTVADVNRPPTADAGTAQTADERSTVTLNGSASDPDTSAPNSQTLTYSWTQKSGPPVALTGANTLSPTFTAPEVGSAGATLSFQLSASDGTATATSSVDVTVIDVNRAPTADAGTPQTADERTVVTLNGSASDPDSGAPDNQTLTYAWLQLAGPAVTLSGASTLTPTFTAPEVGSAGATLMFQLTVSDGTATATSSVDVTVIDVNRAPTADAGTPQTADERTVVTLNGSASDPDSGAPDNQTLTYAWTQLSGVTVTLTGATTLTPTFTAPEVPPGGDTLIFQLAVSDGFDTAVSGTQVTVFNVNRTPVANAGPDQMVDERASVALSGSGTDPDGDPVTYLWTQVAGPTVTLSSATVNAPTFEAPEVTAQTVLSFQLVVGDGVAQSAPDQVNVVVRDVNRAPVADAGVAQTVDAGAKVTLDGSGSLDPDGDPLTYAWTQTGGPVVDVGEATTVAPFFVAPSTAFESILTFDLVVSDGKVSSAPAQVMVSVHADPATADAGTGTGGDAGTHADGGTGADAGANPGTAPEVKTGCGCGAMDGGVAAPGLLAMGLALALFGGRRRRGRVL